MHKPEVERPQALRYNKDKPRFTLLLEAPHALEGVVRVLERGAEKYVRGNWQIGLPFTETIDSAMRHLIAFVNGEDNDPESGLPHLDHALCNIVFLAEHFRTRPDFDDRTNGGTSNGTMHHQPDPPSRGVSG